MTDDRPDPTACPGQCNRQYRADPVNVPPVMGTPVWCPECATRARHALYGLPKLYAQLQLDKERGTRDQGTERLTGSTERPSTSRAADEQDTIARLLTRWEDTLRAAYGLGRRPQRLAAGVRRWPVVWCRLEYGPARLGDPWPLARVTTVTAVERMDGPATAEAATVAGAERFLRRVVDRALADPAHGADLGADLLRVSQRLRQLTKTNPQRRRMTLPCPRCELRSLVHEGGTDHITCSNSQCGRILRMDEYDDMAAELARSKPTHDRKAHA